ncbi:MAG: hypothetical protein M3Z18_11080 [Gemmatimonadota bacterium]|nr:hypothetical protein [Gemmatimonadota bacterium]
MGNALIVAMLLAGGFYMYRRKASQVQPRPQMTNAQINQRWRELGFFCELDDEKKAWTLTGSRAGLLHFPDLLRGYIADPKHEPNGEREHYGPYGSLEVMTWQDAGFDGRAIRGSLTDLERLASLVETNLAFAEPGSQLRVREEFAPDSRYTLLLDIRPDGFDPASADPERLGTADKPKAKGEQHHA